MKNTGHATQEDVKRLENKISVLDRKLAGKSVPGIEPALLSARETAAYIGMSYGAFRTLKSTKPGYLPPAVIRNGCLVWRRTDLDRWISTLPKE